MNAPEAAEKAATLVYVTVPNVEVGRRIARAVVEQRLAACANLVPQIESFYWWDGKVQEDAEALVLFKTRSELVSRLTEAVVELHPYEVPAVSALPLSRVHEPYLQWLVSETSQM